jgi:hypothetical protein
MIAEKHIRHYNRLNGTRISTTSLQAFHHALKRDIDAKRIDSHVPFGIEIIDIEKRIAKVLAATKKNETLLIELKPVSLSKYKMPAKKVVAPKKVKPKKLVKKKQLAKPSPKPVAIPKPKKVETKRLEGIVSSDQIKALSFYQLPIDGKYKERFNKLFNDTKMMFWGLPGSGKTVDLLFLADYLKVQMNLDVLFMANEEMNRSTLTEKLNQFQISNQIAFVEDFIELKKSGKKLSDYDVVFFDSVQSLGIDLKSFKQLAKDNPGTMLILIVQTTKDGDFKGGKEWEHEVDIAGEYVKRKLVLHKNRYDPDFEEKREAMYMEHAVSERKKKSMISRKVKEELNVRPPQTEPQ